MLACKNSLISAANCQILVWRAHYPSSYFAIFTTKFGNFIKALDCEQTLKENGHREGGRQTNKKQFYIPT